MQFAGIPMDIDANNYLMVPETDQEQHHSRSEQSSNLHHITNGYEVCVHTCVEGGIYIPRNGDYTVV